MSVEAASEHVCYVHCNFCNTILAVSVPSSNLFNIVTVRCGHCANLLSVNMGALLQTFPLQEFQNHNLRDYVAEYGSSSKCHPIPMMNSTDNDQLHMLHMRPAEKRQRVPSAYNRFIKEEIQRIKASNPDISHREAFSAAAKNDSKVNGSLISETHPSPNHIIFNLHLHSSTRYGKGSTVIDHGNLIFEQLEYYNTIPLNSEQKWAHLPHIHFGLNLDNNKRLKVDEAIAAEGSQKSQGFY